MALYSDMNGFPESGFPVLADIEDRLTLNTLHYYPIKHLGYKLDVEGNNRLRGNLVLGGTLTGVTSITMAGALSGATTVAASSNISTSGGNVDIAAGNLNLTLGNINMTGFIGSILQRIKKAWFTNLHIQNRPTCGDEDMVALVSDLQSIKIWNETPQALTGITPTFNPVNGINALITVSAATTITFVALIPGQGGVFSVTNSGIQNITLAGSYTFKISRALYFTGDIIETSGSTNLDWITWYYDGVRVNIGGEYNVGS